jgi:hypothetical protein
MVSSIFIEDIFVQLFDLVEERLLPIQHQDYAPMSSFQTTILSGRSLTQSQGNLILKILYRYKTMASVTGLDYNDFLDDPKWKSPFRVIDFSKKVWVETDENNTVWVLLKFPYQLKKEFDDEFGTSRDNAWDPEKKVRKMVLYKYNLVQLFEFANKHGFEIDDTFLSALGEVEEIWEHQDSVIPSSCTQDDRIILKNAGEDARAFWDNRSQTSIASDLLLAKSMGYVWQGQPTTTVEKIAASDANVFWQKDTVEFLNLCSIIDGKICLLLDRAGNSFDWLKKFALDLDKSNFDRNDVRVCFRAEKNQDPKMNEWIKNNGFGGKVEGAKLLIFNHKPAKWLFKEQQSVKILASNNLYQPTNTITRDWFNSHPCVIYVGEIKPSFNKEQKNAEL